mgnify:CR=1 FL=1
MTRSSSPPVSPRPGAGAARSAPAGAVAAAVMTVALAFVPLAASAASPFGVGLAEPAAGGGLLAPFLARVTALQSEFYMAMKTALKTVSEEPAAGLTLVGLSFLYGVFHAVGPGHGKAVISAYVLASRDCARNAAAISLLSGIAQGLTAVALVTLFSLVLGATAIAMTAAQTWLEIGSFALITALGLLLVHAKILRPLVRFAADRLRGPGSSAFAMAAAGAPATRPGEATAFTRSAPDVGTGRATAQGARVRPGFTLSARDHAFDCACCDGLPAPETLSGRLDLRRAASAVLAVGLRPCTGALIILVFASSQQAFGLGLAAVAAMSLGTGATVAAIVLFAVALRAGVERAGGRARRVATLLHRLLEGAAAIVVLLFGLVMLAGAAGGLG